MRLLIVLAVTTTLLCACSKPQVQGYSKEAGSAAPTQVALRPPPPARTPAPLGQPMLAYTYEERVLAPETSIASMAAAHQAACTAAAGQCQVVKAELSRTPGLVSSELTLQATPAWLTQFRERLSRDVGAVGGKIVNSQMQSEDLTRSITDADAMLRAKTTLRDRLEDLLAKHPGKVSDLLEIEQQLAMVQGELDAARSDLAIMRQRVDTSTLTMSYQSKRRDGGDPIGDAVAQAGSVTAASVAALIVIAAGGWPFLLIGAALWFGFRFLRRRKAGEKAPPA